MTERLPDFLTRSADRGPDRVAVAMNDERLSYGYLENLTNRLARLLQAHGGTAGSRVCILAEKTPWTIAGMLATLKIGGAYVPVDSASPAARVARICQAAEPSLVLADTSATALLDEVIGTGGLGRDTPVGSLEGAIRGQRFESAFVLGDAEPFDAEPLPPAEDAGAIAHLLFTSGSTGVPKGVMITHANVVAFVDWAVRYFGIRSGDRLSGHPPLHFDLSTFDIFGAFAAGAELHLVPAELNLNPRGLAAFIRDRQLTQWFSVPSVLTYLARFGAIGEGDLPALRRLLWCGEVLPTAVLVEYMQRLPHVRFTNLYGPTEATIASSHYTLPGCPADDTAPVPIGRPCAGEELLVLDAQQRPAAPGEVGQLHIAGAGLSPGYWRDPDRTAEVFLPDPRSPRSGARIYATGDLAHVDADGLVYFHGRADSQIKSRGYRIELGEVEAAVDAVPGVREAAVVAVDTEGFEGAAICCAFSPLDGSGPTRLQLRSALTRLLPGYMIPQRWAEVEALPTNVNGKIDRKQLAERFARDLDRAGADRPVVAR